MPTASLETTLELWSTTLRQAKHRIRCLVAEHSWDRVRWAIEECAWRFDQCTRPSRPRRS